MLVYDKYMFFFFFFKCVSGLADFHDLYLLAISRPSFLEKY
jgi:hypothetical protein